mgnify:CR=1 FL=1
MKIRRFTGTDMRDAMRQVVPTEFDDITALVSLYRPGAMSEIPRYARGKAGDDGIERVTTQMLFDILDVPQRSRGAGACRRLGKIMAELGWTAVRVRDLTRGGLEQVRGYARDARRHSAASN